MIKGVIIQKLVSHRDERGFFREIARIGNKYIRKNYQLSHSLVNSGVIKGWHGHKKQYQWNYVINGELIVVLKDDRANSITYKKLMKFFINSQINHICYLVPHGVLHSYKCIKGPMNIIYFTSGYYDINEEYKIDLSKDDIKYISSKKI